MDDALRRQRYDPEALSPGTQAIVDVVVLDRETDLIEPADLIKHGPSRGDDGAGNGLIIANGTQSIEIPCRMLRRSAQDVLSQHRLVALRTGPQHHAGMLHGTVRV